MRFNKLPSDEPGDAKPDFSRASDEGESKSAFAWNSEQISNHKIAALLHTQTSRDCKRCRPNRQDGTLQDECVDERRGYIERPQVKAISSGADNERGHRPNARRDHATTPRIERPDGSVQRVAALHEGLPIRGTGQTRNDASEKTKDAETLDKIEASERKKCDYYSD